MAGLVTGRTITDSWLAALGLLHRSPSEEVYDLLVEIQEPAPLGRNDPVVARLDSVLAQKGWYDTETVANTIFPAELARQSADREALYGRYMQILPRLKRLAPNRHGLYFARLISYPLQANATRKNQLELLICRLIDELAKPGPLRHAYELAIHAPGLDTRPIGFPCMSSLSVHLEDGRLRMSATYRNQYYVQRALGNFLGLSRLQQFIASQAGLSVSALSVHAFHAEVDPGATQRNVSYLLTGREEEAA
jgi:hypothetical protein